MTKSRVYTSKAFRTFAEWEYVLEGFKQHIRGNTPDFFGCDFAYNHMDTPTLVREYLSHIHISNPIDNYPSCWLTKPPHKRKNLSQNPEKDYALVYWRDSYRDAYYLLTIIGPDAHDYSVWMPFLEGLARDCERIDLSGHV
ncbi:TPA: type II toxin-antitoxin system YafO family toxin [Vibrio fluvialis]|nr:type II toxin-antitoxin system YafO family toxin [Vibrio fluvialis]